MMARHGGTLDLLVCEFRLLAVALNPVSRGKRGGQTRRAVRTTRTVSGRHKNVPSGNSRHACEPGSFIAGRDVERLSFGYFDQPFGLLKSTSLPFKEK